MKKETQMGKTKFRKVIEKAVDRLMEVRQPTKKVDVERRRRPDVKSDETKVADS